MNPLLEHRRLITRRHFFNRAGIGLGSIALASMLNERLLAGPPAAPDPLAPRPPHFPPRARSIIYLNQTGAPSQFDTFEVKPLLDRLNGQPVPDEYMKGQRFAFIAEGKRPNLLASLWKFEKRGQSGAPVCELLPNISQIVDDVTFIRGMQTDEINHVPAELLMQTGSPRMGRPVMGSWVTYGLGSECSDLPGFIVLTSGKAGRCGTSCWSNGFLPSVYQGVQFRSGGDAVLYLSNPEGMDEPLRRDSLDTIGSLNRRQLADVGDPEIASRISAFELAYRMQTSVPGLMDLSTEPKEIHELYGTEPGKVSFSNNCLLARRLVERGVRFVEVHHGGWDHHGGGDQNLVTGMPQRCREVDRGTMALIMDLKQRGMLDQTLVIWGGEFGRTPMIQGAYNKEDLGRDHLRSAFTIFMAGGGVKRGFSFGQTDDLGMSVVKDPVHVHDFQATVLHLLGLDHTRLTYKFQGRQFRLTDVSGNVVSDIIA